MIHVHVLQSVTYSNGDNEMLLLGFKATCCVPGKQVLRVSLCSGGIQLTSSDTAACPLGKGHVPLSVTTLVLHS